MHRFPAVANQFYPGEAKALQAALARLVPPRAAAEKQKALAVISPHAGYVYSGGVAGETLAAVQIPPDVLIMGPNHQGYGAQVALMHQGSWDMPMGEVPINTTLAGLLLANSAIIKADTLAHQFEHSLEVQVPFLQYLQADLTITPIVVSHLPLSTLLNLGRDIARAIIAYNHPVLLVASSDMTHYESREEASRKDAMAMERIIQLDPEGLYNTVTRNRITMCGVMPATVALAAALELGASKAELIRYTDSGATSGDTNQVVGYAGMVIS